MKPALILVLSIVLSACSSTPKLPVPKVSNALPGGIPYSLAVYARLEKTASGYRFGQFSTNFKASEPWVRLNDGSPMWSTEPEERCQIGMVSADTTTPGFRRCRSIDESLFRGFEVDAARTVAWAVLSLGVGATQPSGIVRFDEPSFQRALREAGGIDPYKEQVEWLDGLAAATEALFELRSIAYSLSVEGAEKTVQIDNQSGLNLDSLAVQQFVRLHPHPLPSPKSNLVTGNLDELLSQYKDFSNTRSRAWETAVSEVRVSCEAPPIVDRWHVALTCPGSVPVTNDRIVVPVKVTIRSRDYLEVLPADLGAGDETLSIAVQNGRVKAANASNYFLSLDSISFYYNGKIASRSKLAIDISPQAIADIIKFDSLPIDWTAIRFTDLTARKARSTSVEYGFAVKYRIVDTSREKTIFQTKEYRLIELIGQK